MCWRADQWSADERAAWELERHRCEVRVWLRVRYAKGGQVVRQHLENIARIRGPEAARLVRKDCEEQWRLGNRGRQGDWRDESGRD